MPTYSLRCRLNACRHRRVATTHPDDLTRRVRCPSCKGFHGWRIEQRHYNRRQLCNCSGPEMTQAQGKNFPHRRHHPLCDNNPWSHYNKAVVLGVPPGYALGLRQERRTVDRPVLIERRKPAILVWPTDIFGGRRMLPDEPCPF